MNKKSYLMKSKINATLDLIVEHNKLNTRLPTDTELAKLLKIGRSTVIDVISYLSDIKIIHRTRQHKNILRPPKPSDYFNLDNAYSSKYKQIETFFINFIMSSELKPGDRFSELELAKKSSCSTGTVREFLNKFSSYRLIEKMPRSQWKVMALDRDLILELTSSREMIAIRAITDLLKLPSDSIVKDELRFLLVKHQYLLDNFETHYIEFNELECILHLVILQASNNRFASSFFDKIFFVGTFYELWSTKNKSERVKIAIKQCIELIKYLLADDIINSILTMKAYINTTQINLLNSLKQLNT